MTTWKLLLIIVLLAAGCTSTVTRYQCEDGTIANTAEECATAQCPDCPVCEPTIEEKVVEKLVEITKYVCADSTITATKEECIDYVDPTWDLSNNKGELISLLNRVKDPLGWDVAVEISKLVMQGDTIEIAYTQIDASYDAKNVGQTIYAVLKTTAKYLQDNKKLAYDIDIRATTSNGGYVFVKTNSKEDVLKILNYDLGMDEWISDIRKQY